MDTNAQPSASLQDYLQLMRLDRPVGTLLLLWPTLAALAMAADGIPPTILIVTFTLGTFLMRLDDQKSTAEPHKSTKIA